MSYTIYNFLNNDDVKVLHQAGQFQVIQWDRDLSVAPWSAQEAWFASQMDVRRRQLVATLDGRTGVTLQAGAMQWTVGQIHANTGVKSAGDLFGKMVRGAVSQDSIIKPEYSGTGMLVCEPTWRHLLLLDLSQWGNSIVLNDGLFLACDSTIRHDLQRRSNMSSAVAGNEGLFNLRLGRGRARVAVPANRSALRRPAKRRAQGRWQLCARMDFGARVRGRALRQVAHRLCDERGGPGERVPWYRPHHDGSHAAGDEL